MTKKKNKPTAQQVAAIQQGLEAEIERLKTEAEATRSDSEAIGACVAIDLNITFNRLLKFLVMYKAIKAKEYKKHGLNVKEFCQSVGEQYRNAHNILEDIAPVFESFSAKIALFSGCKLNEIRLLGREISAKNALFKDGVIVYEGEKYAPSDLKSFLDRVEASYEERLNDYKKQTQKELRQADKEKIDAEVKSKFLEEKLTAYQGLIPDVLKDSKARQRVQVIRGIYDTHLRAVQGVNLKDMTLEDPSSVSELIGHIRQVHRDYIELAHKIEKFEAGE